MREVESPREREAEIPAAPGNAASPLRSRRWWEYALDTIAVLGVVAVLALPIAAAASSPTAKQSDTATLPPLPDGPRGPPLRVVPAFTPGGAVATAVASGALPAREPAMKAAIERQVGAAFGARGAPDIAALAMAPSGLLSPAEQPGARQPSYPYRFAGLAPMLDRAFGTGALTSARVAAVNDLAGLLVLAAVRFPGQFHNAAAIAYALYDEARRTDACEPQLNLANLLSMDFAPPGDAVATEFRRAARDCPGDPAPLWLFGEYQSLRGESTPSAFVRLEHQYPRSALGWSGEADALVRFGYRVDVGEPFTARAAFRRALGLYRLAERLDADPGLAAGEARAAAGLGDAPAAVRAQRRALTESGNAAPFRVRMLDYLERDHRFADAARENAATLGGDAATPPRAGVIAMGRDLGDGVSLEDALGPISVGTATLQAASLDVGSAPLAFTGQVEDISFIPSFRSVVEVTGDATSCRAGSLARDLLVAGRPAAALAAIAEGDANRWTCSVDQTLLPSVAQFERGDRRAAIAAVAPDLVPPELMGRADERLATVFEADQNMWRYAGDLDHAAAIAARWTTSEPSDPFGPDRAGEIAYLQRDFRAAASDFAEAASRATGELVASERLKEGAALDEGGNPAAAVPALTSADRVASATAREKHPHSSTAQAELDSYNARLQAGDAESRRHDFAAAEADDEAARAREPQLRRGEQQGYFTTRQEELFRPEVLENNEALVLHELGRDRDALAAINRAVAFDPADPVFLANRGFIDSALGHDAAAVPDYRAALAADPASFQAANNLGVILADEHHLGPAANAFRKALAANADDATAAFNLGLVLDRMGPTHLVAAEGALAAAVRLEPELAEHDHTLIVDDETYFSTLDLSKPVPPTWHFASTATRAPITVGAALFVLLLFRLAKGAVQDRASDKVAERALETSTRRLASRLSGLGTSAPAAWAVAAVVAVLVYPLARSAGTTRNDIVVLGAGVAVVTLAFMRLRSAIALRTGVVTRHYPWIPAVLVGGAAALVGIGFAPMPATKGEGRVPNRARWLGTGLLGALAITLLVLGRFTGVPFATELGAICLLMTASALVPIEPYDGAFVTKRHVELTLVVVLAGLALLVEARLL